MNFNIVKSISNNVKTILLDKRARQSSIKGKQYFYLITQSFKGRNSTQRRFVPFFYGLELHEHSTEKHWV